jgi:hypothetical protein
VAQCVPPIIVVISDEFRAFGCYHLGLVRLVLGILRMGRCATAAHE